MTESAVTTVNGQPSFLTTIFSRTVTVSPKDPFSVLKDTTEIETGDQTFTPPIVESKTQTTGRYLTIKGVPPVNSFKLNHSALERILNHIKDSYMKGEFDDAELESYYNSRTSTATEQDLRFCVAYTFAHNGKDTLKISFYVSYTDSAPAWGKYTRKGEFVPVTSMSQDEVNLVTNAFVRQCKKALGSYTALVYNDAIVSKTTPNYYSALPKE